MCASITRLARFTPDKDASDALSRAFQHDPIKDTSSQLVSQGDTKHHALRFMGKVVEMVEKTENDKVGGVPDAPWFGQDITTDGDISGWYALSGSQIGQVLGDLGFTLRRRSGDVAIFYYKHPETGEPRIVSVSLLEKIARETEEIISQQCGAEEYESWYMLTRILANETTRGYETEVNYHDVWSVISNIVTLYGLSEITKKGLSYLSECAIENDGQLGDDIEPKTLDEFGLIAHDSQRDNSE